MKKKKVSNFLSVFLIVEKRKLFFGIGILLFSLLTTLTLSTSLLSEDEEVKNVEFESKGWSTQEPGSWHINKSAEWTGYKKAQVKFEVDSIEKKYKKKDIVLILDISGSMNGKKIDKVREDAKELTEIALSDSENRIALISFHSQATILSDFTNDKDKIISMIDSLSTTGATNYTDALRKTSEALNSYQQETNRDLVALFLSDGYPCVETPNQIGEYAVLKENYLNLTMNAIQYEMGSTIINELKEISDNQYLAYKENLQNVLFEASINAEFYEKFIINDYIDEKYFELGTIEEVKVSKGTATLTEENGLQKVTWDLGSDYRTGSSATMTIDLKLKDDIEGDINSIFPTNRKEDVEYKIPDEPEEKQEEKLTPKLRGVYEVIYDVNTPDGCSISSISIPKETHFIYDTVTIRSNENDLEGKCSGYLFKGWEMTDESSIGTSKINDDTFIMPSKNVTLKATWSQVSISKSMTGEKYELKYIMPFNGQEGFIDSPVNRETEGLMVKKGTEEGDNPIFYYRGNVKNNYVLFANKCWRIVRSTETGGTKLIYNGLPRKLGAICNNTGENIYISSESDGIFNTEYNNPAYTGYMYSSNATKYASESKDMSSSGSIEVTTIPIEENEYINIENDTTYAYSFDISTKKWTSNMHDHSKNASLKFSVATEGTYYFAYTISSEEHFDKAIIKVNDTQKGPEISGNASGILELGTLTSTDVIEVIYLKDSGSSTGSDNIVFSIEKPSGPLLDNRWLYGNSVTYSNGTYTLQNTKKVTWGDDISSNHYTCFSTGNTCTIVNYIYYINDNMYNKEAFYYALTDGKTIEDVINESIPNNETRNEISSTIKEKIDSWFASEDGIISYTSYLEDTIWCNDRTIVRLGGWNPDGGSTSSELIFESGIRKLNYDFTCSNKYDRFTLKSTVSNSNTSLDGNEKLDYPVGLITLDEAQLTIAGSFTYLNNSSTFWTLSPHRFFNYPVIPTLYLNGVAYLASVDTSYGVRPAISLRSGVTASSGDGSAANPYRVG